eukprot:gene38605-46933_t
MKPRSTFVVGIENIEVASSVIRSLRSSAGSQKRYQQHARDDNVLVEGVSQLNTVIGKEKDKIFEENQKQQKISDAITNFDGSMMLSLDSPMGKSTMSGSQHFTRSPGKQVRSELSDSDDEKDISSKYVQQKHRRNTNQRSNNDDSEDDDLLDNDEDNSALFKDFVPPSQATSSRSKDLSGSSNKAFTSKLLSGSSLGGTTAALDSAATKSGITIKPGQAIRVKPSSKNKKL